ncbi:efflux RND transporter periplasmic adaptor subunit [Legionella sp. CNM-1927-20]|uniref:efflux RND transporter periplasmic adaptor subunit n=1 Tax=Legionella sp. CNM-1927-20 TaxID=3422221 RepID=UPI00403A9ACC
MKGRVISLIFFLSVLITFAYYFFPNHKASQVNHKIQPIFVETSPLKEALFANEFETIGSLSSLDNIQISSELAGQIARIYFKPGTLVQKGTLLIQLDDTILKSELASAKANLLLSESIYQRNQELAKRKLASEQALETAFADLKEKQNTVKVKEAQLLKLSLRAPFTGTLGSRKVSVGQYVKVGQPLVSLIANQKLKVEYTLPEHLISHIKKDQKVQVISDAYPRQVYQGVVDYIAPNVDKETRTIAVEALIDNKQNLLSPGLFVRVKHQIGEPIKRFLIPEESVIPTISGQKVFILNNGRAIAKQIKVGSHYGAMIEVRRGLKPTDIVIIRGQHKLKEGATVLAKNEGKLE